MKLERFDTNRYDPSEVMLKATWSYVCVYNDGSKTGSAPCEEQLVGWEGRYGELISSTVGSSSSTSTTSTTTAPTSVDSQVQLAAISASIVAASLAVAYAFYRRQAARKQAEAKPTT